VTPEQLLALHDEQIRGTVADRLPDTWEPTRDGPVLQVQTLDRDMAFANGLGDLDRAGLGALVERVKARAAARGKAVEWKTYGHDRADLTEVLAAAGFAPEEPETIVIGAAADLTDAGEAVGGVTIRATADPADLRRIADLQSEVWGSDMGWLAGELANRIASAPDRIDILVAEAGGEVVSAAWLVAVPGTDFAMLWGGSTLERWRGKGIYRALVAQRARLAVRRGTRYLMVDASKDSSPILQRLGLRAVGTTTPWVWKPV
jgi:hypothetical protein